VRSHRGRLELRRSERNLSRLRRVRWLWARRRCVLPSVPERYCNYLRVLLQCSRGFVHAELRSFLHSVQPVAHALRGPTHARSRETASHLLARRSPFRLLDTRIDNFIVGRRPCRRSFRGRRSGCGTAGRCCGGGRVQYVRHGRRDLHHRKPLRLRRWSRRK
jgi:hypothetical protein